MGDMRDDFDVMRSVRQARHANWKRRNIAVLQSVGAKYNATNDGETFLFREAGKPKVDFYPSTGRWRVAGLTRTFSGGAESFLNWYAKQGASTK